MSTLAVKQTIYNLLKQAGYCDNGIYGLMGNLFAESAFNPKNLQQSYEKKLGYTDETYTQAVDNGTYKNFVKDGAGYGLAQWTYWSRKQAMLEYHQKAGKSIGNLETQVAFMVKELKGYSSVHKVLMNASSIKEASDCVLTQYERPADQSDAVKVKRASYGEAIKKELEEARNEVGKTRASVVALANSWLGKNEADGSHKSIIDIYNTLPVDQLPRRTKMLYTWAWCACTWSALAVKLGYTDIMPIEISCYYLIEAAKKMGIWIEEDNRVPKLGEGVLYDWDDGVNYKTTDNKGAPEHVGVVIEVNVDAGHFVVTEGNFDNAVKKRTLSINGRYIRGFISPKYDEEVVIEKPIEKPVEPNKSIETLAREVIAGSWGSGTTRKQRLEAAGYDYSKVQARVNEILNGKASKPTTVTPTAKKSITATDYATKKDTTLSGAYKTTTGLNMRHGAGTNKKSMVVIPKHTEVKCFGYYSIFNGAKWYYVQVTLDNVKYTGFCHGSYLKKQ